MVLWLDDFRDPMKYGYLFARWAKTYEEAIQLLKTGEITFASLDHDLGWESTLGLTTFEKTGYDVVSWMEEHNVWPINGVAVHSVNPVGVDRMEQVIERHYGRTFNSPIPDLNGRSGAVSCICKM